MTPTDLLNRLADEGVSLSLNLKLEADVKPADETRTLIRDNRDVLLTHLGGELVGTSSCTRAPGLTLYGDLLHSLTVWVSQSQELRIKQPCGLVLNAKPKHVEDAVARHPWGVVYSVDRRVLATWGDVPDTAFERELLTGDLLVYEEPYEPGS